MRYPHGIRMSRFSASRVITSAFIALSLLMLDGSTASAAEPTDANVQKLIDAKRQEIYDLQQQLIPLLRTGRLDGAAAVKEKITAIENEIAARSQDMAQLAAGGNEAVGQARMAEQLAAIQAQMANRQGQYDKMLQQYQEAMQRAADAQRVNVLPPLKDPVTKVYELRYLPADRAAAVIFDLFGAGARVAQDGQRLIVAADNPPSGEIEALLQSLDTASSGMQESSGGDNAVSRPSASNATLLVRLFWIGDDMPDKESASKSLPAGVVKALDQLGLHKPVLISQAVNSLTDDTSDALSFSTRIPTVVFNQSVELHGDGSAKWLNKDHMAIRLNLNVTGAMSCDLAGSLATPLGHYMVLGTANSTIMDQPSGTDPNTGMPVGFGAPVAGVAGRFAGGEGGGFEGGVAAAPAAKLISSKLAFVVQVIENQSYPADK